MNERDNVSQSHAQPSFSERDPSYVLQGLAALHLEPQTTPDASKSQLVSAPASESSQAAGAALVSAE